MSFHKAHRHASDTQTHVQNQKMVIFVLTLVGLVRLPYIGGEDTILGHKSENNHPRAKSGPGPVGVNNALMKHSLPTDFCTIYGSFHPTAAGLGRYNRVREPLSQKYLFSAL